MTTYRSPFAASMAIHVGVAIALFMMVSVPIHRGQIGNHVPAWVDLASYRRALAGPDGGGGGERSLLRVSKGQLPKQSPHPYTPPMILASAKEPVLLMEPALLTAPEMPTTSLPQWGDPLSSNLISSSGTGAGGGMGSGDGGGFGPGHGQGSGPGPGGPGGSGTISMRMSGGGYSPPKVIYQVDPEFSEEARRAKHYGTVILVVDVDTTGRAVNVRVARSLGLGLDEKAVEAVSRWRFRPGMRGGRPVTAPATIEVNFHLL
jgi:TonB family protein